MWSYRGLIGLLQSFLLFITPILIHGQYRDGDIRLVGGSYQWEGRVEIHFSGTWGTITDSEWSSDDAQVVCRKLGHFKPGATAHSGAYFGEGSGTIHLDAVECSGSEYNLTDCETQSSGISTSHSMDVGVKCQPADGAYREGDIRLVGGSHNREGRVEIYWMGTWGTISDSSWSSTDARVVCSQLGHSINGVINHCCAYYGQGSGKIHIRVVTCSGSETNITGCAYYNNTIWTSHAQDVGVQCQQGDAIKEGDIRLVGGSYLWQGRVEIFLSGVWGTIYSGYASSVDARVVCRQLGYNTLYIRYDCCARFGEGSGPVHVNTLHCYGTEHRVTACQYTNNTIGRYHNRDWSVYCMRENTLELVPDNGDVRLYSGRVEVLLSGSWKLVAVTDVSWTQENSEVVCRELGFVANGTGSLLSQYSISQSTADNHIDGVSCRGSESKLTDCSHRLSTLKLYNYIRIQCQPNDCYDRDMRLVGGDNEMEGRVEVCNSHRWGTVCESYWTDRHTAVVCRHLGFSDTVGDSAHFTSKKFGEGTGPVFMDYVNCTGSEPRLWGKCSHFTHYYGCSHSGDVGVRCQPASCSDGQIKLIEGSSQAWGRVEICSNQRWETLSYYYWNSYATFVACTELGFSSYLRYWPTARGGGPMHPLYFQCRRTEARLSQCESHNRTVVISHNDDVGISCRLASCSDGEVRLVEGESEWEGRLEVCFNRRWGTVSSDGWTQTNTQVICNDLGYQSADKTNSSVPQSLSKPVYLHNVICSRSDLTLLECSFTKYSGNINDIQDVIIHCQQSTCSDGDIKLVGGISETEGRLEVCFGQRWGTIHGDGWTQADTQVACRQLGYPTSGVSHTKTQRTRKTTSPSLPVHLTLVGCYSSEEKLIDCAHHEYTSSSTSESMDISIICGSTTSTSTTSTLINSTGSTSAKSDIVSTVSLSIAVICVSAIVVLVVVLILVFLFRQRKKQRIASNQHDTELRAHHSTHDSDARDRYTAGTSYFNQLTGNVSYSIGDKIINPVLDDMADPAPALPPKPQQNPSKKPGVVQVIDTMCYTHNAQQNLGKPPAANSLPVNTHAYFQGQVQQAAQYPPEVIYEAPD